MLARPKTLLLAALIAIAVTNYFSGHFNAYYLDIIIGIGINVILAVSLNLINGYTGQFSLGHAGFMAVGAYTSAAITMFFGQRFFSMVGDNAVTTAVLFCFALVAGGLMAAFAGLLVGVPS